MRVLNVVHQDSAGPGVFAEVTGERGDTVDVWEPPQQGPPPVGDHDAVFVFGGAMHVDQEDEHPWLTGENGVARGAGRPAGAGARACAWAASCSPRPPAPCRTAPQEGEVGWHEVELCPEAAGDPLLGSLPDRFDAFEWHQYEFPLPPGAVPLARSDRCLQAFRLDGPAWGLQFHAEVVRSSIDRWLDKAEDGRGRSGARGRGDRGQAGRAGTSWAAGSAGASSPRPKSRLAAELESAARGPAPGARDAGDRPLPDRGIGHAAPRGTPQPAVGPREPPGPGVLHGAVGARLSRWTARARPGRRP